MKYIKHFEEYVQDIIINILDKSNEFGYDSLSDDEKNYLNNADEIQPDNNLGLDGTQTVENMKVDTNYRNIDEDDIIKERNCLDCFYCYNNLCEHNYLIKPFETDENHICDAYYHG